MFGNLMKAVVGLAALPFDVVSDVVTLGGAVTDSESAVVKRIGQINDNIDKAVE